MPNWDRVLSTDTRQKVVITASVTNASGIPYQPVKYVSVGNYEGKLRSTLCNRTKKPGSNSILLRPHPIEHAEINSAGSADKAITLCKSGPNGTIVPAVTLTGSLAAYCGEGAIFSFPARPAVDDRAIACLVSAVSKTHQPALDIGMMLAEGSETLRMLVSPFGILKKALNPLVRVAAKYNMLRSTPGGLTQKGIDKMGEAWLLYRYGISPTIKDVTSIIGHVNKTLKQQLDLRKSHHNRTVTDFTTSQEVGPVTTLPGCYLWGVKTSRTKQHLMATDLFRSSLDGASDFGAGVYDAPSLVWELVPFSFVVDWLANVGDWIRAITPKPGVTHFANYISTVTDIVNIFQIDRLCADNPEGNPGYPSVMCNSRYQVHAKAYGRGIGYSLPSYPTVKYNTLNWKQSLDSVALAWLLLPGFKR